MKGVTPWVIVLLAAGHVLACGSGSQSRRASPAATPPPPATTVPPVCSAISFLHGTASDVRRAVLRTLCAKGHQHVQLKTSTAQRTSAKDPVRRTEQLAVLNLHRDSFSSEVKWEAGEATDVINAAKWFLDEEVPLSNGYSWYRQGLPLWPMLDQALTQKEGLANRNKKPDWPNYAIATPLYVAAHEAANSRDLSISVRKLFAGDTARTQQSANLNFASSAKFQTSVLDFVKEVFQDQYGYTRADIGQTFQDPGQWLQPLVNRSLRPMLESFIKRQKTRAPKGSNVIMCPDEVFLFFLRKPCAAANSCQVILDVQQQLRVTNCVNTDVVVGFPEARSASRG